MDAFVDVFLVLRVSCGSLKLLALYRLDDKLEVVSGFFTTGAPTFAVPFAFFILGIIRLAIPKLRSAMLPHSHRNKFVFELVEYRKYDYEGQDAQIRQDEDGERNCSVVSSLRRRV